MPAPLWNDDSITISHFFCNNQFPALEHQRDEFQFRPTFGAKHLFVRCITHQLFSGFLLQGSNLPSEASRLAYFTSTI